MPNSNSSVDSLSLRLSIHNNLNHYLSPDHSLIPSSSSSSSNHGYNNRVVQASKK